MKNATSSVRKDTVKEPTLMDSLGAVSAALSAMPESAFKTNSPLADAFLQTDPVLSLLDKQRLDANQQYNALVRAYGFNDAMTEAANFQRAQIEEAYRMRLGALRRRQSEGRKQNIEACNDDELIQEKNRKAKETRQRQLKREEEERLLQEQLLVQQKQSKHSALMWLLIGLAVGSRQSAYYQPRPALTPI